MAEGTPKDVFRIDYSGTNPGRIAFALERIADRLDSLTVTRHLAVRNEPTSYLRVYADVDKRI